METYKPTTPPFWKRFFGNLTVQLSLLVLIAGGVGVSLYKKGQKNFAQRSKQYQSGVQISHSFNSSSSSADSAKSSHTTSSAKLTDSSPSEETEGAEVKPMVAERMAKGAAVGEGTNAPSQSATGTQSRSPANVSESHLEVYYAEVNRRALNNIFTTSRNSGQFMNFNDYSAGILPNIDKALADSSVKVLFKEIKSLNGTKSFQWFYGIKSRQNPEMEIGLTTFLDINDIDGSTLRGNFEIQRNWREASSTGTYEIQHKSFPAIFEIGGGTGFFMSGIMPLQSNLQNDDELTAIDVYKILRSTQFRSGDSDFVIFVKFEKANKAN
ncbi:MAG: hypothetical protein ACXVCP_07015 [Bdellovibrio sp.]